MARRLAATLVALAAVLAIAGTATASHKEPTGTTSTGDVDIYNLWPYTTGMSGVACPSIAYQAEVTLELLHPTIGDRVSISGQHTTADAAVATWEDPVVTLTYQSGRCGGAVEVVGLTVSGDLPYNVTGRS